MLIARWLSVNNMNWKILSVNSLSVLKKTAIYSLNIGQSVHFIWLTFLLQYVYTLCRFYCPHLLFLGHFPQQCRYINSKLISSWFWWIRAPSDRGGVVRLAFCLIGPLFCSFFSLFVKLEEPLVSLLCASLAVLFYHSVCLFLK